MVKLCNLEYSRKPLSSARFRENMASYSGKNTRWEEHRTLEPDLYLNPGSFGYYLAWDSYLTFNALSFLVYKPSIIYSPLYRVIMRIQWKRTEKLCEDDDGRLGSLPGKLLTYAHHCSRSGLHSFVRVSPGSEGSHDALNTFSKSATCCNISKTNNNCYHFLLWSNI